jgi:hypothetical protein
MEPVLQPKNVLESGKGPLGESIKEIFMKAAGWFLPAVGLAYACGFLIVFTFFKSFGINDVEFLEARYIHIGSLFIMACIAILLPISWALFVAKLNGDKELMHVRNVAKAAFHGKWGEAKKELKIFSEPSWQADSKHGIHATSAVLGSGALMLWSFLLLVTFAKPAFPEDHPKLLLFNFLLPLVIILLAMQADNYKDGWLHPKSDEILKRGRRSLREYWLILGICLLLVFLLLPNWFDRESNMFIAVFIYFLPPIIVIVHYSVRLSRFWPLEESSLITNTRKEAIKAKQHIALTQWRFYAIQWGLFLAQCWVFARTIMRLGADLWEIIFGKNWHWWKIYQKFPGGGIYFVFFMVLIFFFGFRNLYRFKRATDESHKRQLIISTVCVLGMLFYFSVLSFSHFIYPYIPAVKGGGDYSLSSPVQLMFATNYTNSIPQAVMDGNRSNQLIVLDENINFVFLADTNDPDTNGPAGWRNGNKPKVYEIRREAIISIAHSNPAVTTNSNMWDSHHAPG